MSFLDTTGLSHFWAHCISKFAQADALEELKSLIGDVPEGQTIIGIIETIQESGYDDTELVNKIEALEDLVGTSSVASQIDNKIAAIDFPVDSVNGKTGAVVLTASDVGALPATTEIPSLDGLATEDYVDNAVASMVDSAPETLNTLNELAAALGDDPNFATTVANQIGTIESEVDGKVSKAGDTMTGSLTVSSTSTGDTDVGVSNPNGHIAIQVAYNRGLWDYNKAAWVLRAPKDSTDWYLDGEAASSALLKSSATPTFGINGLQYFNASLTNSGTASESYAPTVDWWHILRMNHANTNGYYTDIGACLNNNHLAYRRVAAGSDQGWKTLLDTGNFTNWVTPSSIGAVNKAGDTMTGTLQVPYLKIKHTANNSPSIAFYNKDSDSSRGGLQFDASDERNRFYFFQYHADMDGLTTRYADCYIFPNATAGRTAHGWYTILTTKSAVTVAQGGTGATDKGTACQNLMSGVSIEPAAVELYPPSASVNHGGFIDFHYNCYTGDHTSRIIESSEHVLDINTVSGGKVRLGTVTSGTWNGSAVGVAYGGTGATTASAALTNLGALPGQTISYTLSTAGWYRIASSAASIGNNIGDFIVAGGGSGTHSLISFKASISSGKYPQIVQSLNTTYSGANQYTKARIVYHTTYSGNYAYLEVYKNGTASSSTKFMYTGTGWTLQSPTAGSIPDGYTSYEFSFVPQTSIARNDLTASRALVSDSTGNIVVSAVTSTELGYLDGVTSAIQTQLNNKADSSHTHSYLPLSGGTLTGTLTMKGSLYSEGTALDDTLFALDMNNSNIIGANGIYMNDASDGITEGIHFYRSATTYDSLWAASGKLYFTPNRPLQGAGTAYTVYHTGNKPTEIVNGLATLTTGINATPLLSMKKNGYDHWAIERVGDTDNRLKWHYYDPTTGAWSGHAFLLDSYNWDDYALSRNPAQIEMIPGTSAGHGGYIDFHFNGSTADYTSRIIESASGILTVNGTTFTNSNSTVTMSGLLTGTRAHFTSTTDASETSQNNVALRLGSASGIHMDLDNNEIIAKTDATTQGTLYLNGLAIAAGGGVSGNMTVSGTLTAAKVVGAVYA